jgi:predicted nucleotidyltransferase component of viral defense system
MLPMSLFNRLVDEALREQPLLAPLRSVVEKELLHHDILREMAEAGLLRDLTFIGGTCLRACYGSNRLSEDLDFTGGADFNRTTLKIFGRHIESRLHAKYGLSVTVSEPTREGGNVDTWKIKVVTRPDQKHLPAQRINIDICAIPSHDRRPMVLRNPYGVEMGTGGLILQAESREEIFADKVVALALRPNRIKNRDLWDIGWLRQRGIELPLDLIPKKITDHRRDPSEFLALLAERMNHLQKTSALRDDFVNEMKRFLPIRALSDMIGQEPYWQWLTATVGEESLRVAQYLNY